MTEADDERLTNIRTIIAQTVSNQNVSHREAAQQLLTFADQESAALIERVVVDLELRSARARILDDPLGARVADELSQAAWYEGPSEHDSRWLALKVNMLRDSPDFVVQAVDNASTKIVGNLADPTIIGGKVQGLVLGHVQAGKTANYTAVCAKAVDRGYRLVIVLAGIHNNLRSQTQVRLQSDLGDAKWTFLTQESTDFNGQVSGANLVSSRGIGVMIVIKKNAARLKILRNWLNQLGEDLLRRVPVLIIDDEADQATPNSATKQDEQTAINRLVSEIWASVVTGSYVGYTATPFANILIDPNDPTQLYPRDFIVELPRSDDYFGAERIFGREPLDADDPGSDGLDIVRNILPEEASSLTPSRSQAEVTAAVPKSLDDAIRWFVVATAIRRSRGQDKHSSMLVHTTHRVHAHFAIASAIRDHLGELAELGPDAGFKEVFESEIARSSHPNRPSPGWSEIAPEIISVLEEITTIVDNGSSTDRLDYRRVDGDGTAVVETVIAVGGGTLSRGLTLEGLVVSYFARTSNTYDALLQMGRWFGYRIGYEDSVRVWVTEEMLEDFRFLALVEEEIRQEVRSMARQRLAPKDFAVRIRQHVGRLNVTSPGKLRHAKVVDLSYNGARLQTFILHEHEQEIQEQNLAALRALISSLPDESERNGAGLVYRDVPQQVVLDFIRAHRVHEDQTSINKDLIEQWLRRAHPDGSWNVVLASSRKHDAVQVEVVPGVTLGASMRSALEKVKDAANIKALLSQKDWLADISEDELAVLARTSGPEMEKRRASSVAAVGALVVMIIDKDSEPDRLLRTNKIRRGLQAPQHLVGYGLIFPYSQDLPMKDSGYISVTVPQPVVIDDDEESYEEGEVQ